MRILRICSLSACVVHHIAVLTVASMSQVLFLFHLEVCTF